MEHEARRSSCYNCGSLEHLARFCPQGPPADGPRPGRAGGGRSRAGGPGGGGDLSLAQRILRTASGPGALDAGVLRLREVVMRNEGRPDQLAEASHALVAEADAGRVAIVRPARSRAPAHERRGRARARPLAAAQERIGAPF